MHLVKESARLELLPDSANLFHTPGSYLKDSNVLRITDSSDRVLLISLNEVFLGQQDSGHGNLVSVHSSIIIIHNILQLLLTHATFRDSVSVSK